MRSIDPGDDCEENKFFVPFDLFFRFFLLLALFISCNQNETHTNIILSANISFHLSFYDPNTTLIVLHCPHPDGITAYFSLNSRFPPRSGIVHKN